MLLPETLIEMLLVEEAAHGYVEPTRVKMKCFRADYRGELTPSSEIAWFNSRDRHRCAPAAQRVLEALSNQGLID